MHWESIPCQVRQRPGTLHANSTLPGLGSGIFLIVFWSHNYFHTRGKFQAERELIKR